MIIEPFPGPNPVTSPDEVAVQVKVVPTTFEVRLIFVKVDEQICLFIGIFDMSGGGLMVTT